MTTHKLKAYKKGSECPPLERGKMRVYSMRFCPYAERTRLILVHLNVPHEVVNINLCEKPEWFLAKSPLGSVPVLEIDDKIIYVSPICDEYLDEVYGKNQLLTTDPYKKAQQKMLLERFLKLHEGFYVAYKSKDSEEIKKGFSEVRKTLKVLEEHLHGKYFGGEKPNLVDLHIWPWFERFKLIHKLTGQEVFKPGSFPKLEAWIETMLQLPAVKACISPLDSSVEFVKQDFDPSVPCPDYDIGL